MAQGGNCCGYEVEVGWLVEGAGIGWGVGRICRYATLGEEVWGVGLDEESIKGQRGGSGADSGGFGVADCAGD